MAVAVSKNSSRKTGKTLIVGNGWIGNMLKDFLQADMSEHRLEDIDPESISMYDTVINCAGKTNIDWCEGHKSGALATNALAAAAAANVCEKLGKKYVFLSSACIFESMNEADWKDEFSAPNPGCFYALTKVVAEHLVLEASPRALLIRIRLPISAYPNPRNTLTKLLTYSTLHTNQETVTVVEDMLPIFKSLMERDESGVFHLVNDGTISPLEMRASIAAPGVYTGIAKADLDVALRAAGRAKRVSTLVRSTRIPPLPFIGTRMPAIARAYEAHL